MKTRDTMTTAKHEECFMCKLMANWKGADQEQTKDVIGYSYETEGHKNDDLSV